MVNGERQIVWREKTTLDLDYENLAAAAKTINDLAERYGWKARIVKREYAYSDGTYLSVEAEEPETDEEMAKRIAADEQRKAQQDATERLLYERLKAKFG